MTNQYKNRLLTIMLLLPLAGCASLDERVADECGHLSVSKQDRKNFEDCRTASKREQTANVALILGGIAIGVLTGGAIMATHH